MPVTDESDLVAQGDHTPTTTNPQSGFARFRPRARLIGLIGEDLISDEPVAVVELVKNSYDADATRVHVTFDDTVVGGRIIVHDNGVGMGIDTVLTSWFEPGTLSKYKVDRSPGGRVYQGAKGIGRFATARLASTLLLESKTAPSGDGVVVLFDWGSFDAEGFLDELEIAWEMAPIPDLPRGTRLTLDQLRRTWDENDYRNLHARLSRLISPFNEVQGFTIELTMPGPADLSGTVQAPELLSRPRYKLVGTLDSEGLFTGRIEHNEREVEQYARYQLRTRGDAPRCGPLDVELRAWDRDREGLGPLSVELNQRIIDIRRLLNDYCGVSIYRDGFRVYPYGQQGNDWLGLDNRSRQVPARQLANNQIVGAIRISRAGNADLRDRSNREGLVHNEAYEDLRTWFVEILNLLEIQRYKLRPRRETMASREPLFEAFDVTDAVRQARETLGKRHEVVSLIEGLERQVTEGVERVQEVFSRLLLSAGLGQMVDIIIHEIGAPLGKLNRQLSLLERAIKGSSDPSLPNVTAPMFVSLRTWLAQIHNLRQRLDPQTAGRRGRATTFDVRQEVEDTFQLYAAVIAGQVIRWTLQAPPDGLVVTMPRAVLGQILANLIDNAIFWIVREHGAGKGGAIVVRIDARGDGFAIVVSDDGPGVDDDDRDRIFDPYYSRKPNGIGLGLYIARLVIEPYGRLIYRDDGELPGACFEATFEHGVGL